MASESLLNYLFLSRHGKKRKSISRKVNKKVNSTFVFLRFERVIYLFSVYITDFQFWLQTIKFAIAKNGKRKAGSSLRSLAGGLLWHSLVSGNAKSGRGEVGSGTNTSEPFPAAIETRAKSGSGQTMLSTACVSSLSLVVVRKKFV